MLLEVHGELTHIAADRDEMARLLEAPLGISTAGPKAELRRRAGKLRKQLGRLRRRLRSGEVNELQAARQLVRIAYANTLQEPLQWTARQRYMRSKAGKSAFMADRPLRRAQTPAGYETGELWKEVLEERHGQDPEFLLAARRLAVKRGDMTENLDLSVRLARKDARFRGTVAQANGRGRELSGWIPRIPGPFTPVEPASPDRVLHLVKESRPYFSNGFTSRSQENFKAERLAGLDPVVLTEPGFPRNVVGADFDLVETVEGIEHHRLDTGLDYSGVPSDRWLEDFAWLAYRKVQQIRPAVIHVSSGRRGYETALVALALKAKTGIPVVYEVRSFFEGNWTGETAFEDQSEIYRRRVAVENMCMQEADAVLTLGTAMRDELASRGIPAEKIGLVPNGVNLENFTPAPVDPALRRRYGITMPTFGYVSNMDHPREGQENLIRAAAELRSRGVRAQCVLVGGGSRLQEMKLLARSLDVEDRVVFTGPVDHAEVSSHYALIDVFVVPRIRERAAVYVTPLKPFEAMAMERPVVVSDLPALAEIVEAPSRGRVFRPGDHEQLAGVVAALLADPGLREDLGRAGREWIESERQWKHNGPRYRHVFESVAARSGTGRTEPQQTQNEGA